MSNLVVIGFNDEHRADEILLTLRRLEHEDLMDLEDAAVVIKQRDGRVIFRRSHNLSGVVESGGGFWGAFFSLVFADSLETPEAGAAPGDATGKLNDIGIEDDFIKEITDLLEPDSSAIFILVVKIGWYRVVRVLDDMRQYHGKVIHTALSKDDEAALVEALS